MKHVQLTIRVPEPVFKLICAEAEKRKLGMAEWGREVIAEHFNQSQSNTLLTQIKNDTASIIKKLSEFE